MAKASLLVYNKHDPVEYASITRDHFTKIMESVCLVHFEPDILQYCQADRALHIHVDRMEFACDEMDLTSVNVQMGILASIAILHRNFARSIAAVLGPHV